MYKTKTVVIRNSDDTIKKVGKLHIFSDRWENVAENRLPHLWEQALPDEHVPDYVDEHFYAFAGELFLCGQTILRVIDVDTGYGGMDTQVHTISVTFGMPRPGDLFSGTGTRQNPEQRYVLSEFLKKIELGIYLPLNNALRAIENI